jgi:hypothetical protein
VFVPSLKKEDIWLPKFLLATKFLELEASWRPEKKLKIKPCICAC